MVIAFYSESAIVIANTRSRLTQIHFTDLSHPRSNVIKYAFCNAKIGQRIPFHVMSLVTITMGSGSYVHAVKSDM